MSKLAYLAVKVSDGFPRGGDKSFECHLFTSDWLKGARSSAGDQFVRVLVKEQLHFRFHPLLEPTRGFE